MKRYSQEDFIRIRNFLVNTYTYFQRPYNWTIERWNFSISMARIMNGVPLETWESQIAIWEHDQEIVGVVNSEGEDDGEAFFQMAHEQLSDDILQEMFTFCEAHLGKQKNGKRVVYLRIPLDNLRVEQIALSRNYSKQPGIESVSELSLEQEFPVKLAEGFSFKSGDEVSVYDKGKAHAKAFGYFDETVYRERSPFGYQAMSETPDYRPDLDIHVLSPDHEIAAFATMWCDQRNRIGILEPVGTIPRYRKMGLGRASIMQLANQVKQEGGSKVYVGSGEDFYQRLGFHVKGLYGVWVKEINIP
ncbi:MAG: hypothetical protein AMJ88_15405 [Anaerolineae bacterium SM23_ 63]|nr:MAG: hypothetical protein AMJ88_15405 [Anaerolineae bacterium SM23_ 63]HEY45449.1 GNAT family N-acetyltransferase [Anaerolineae bacterium]